jgi:hypothetical protein
MTDALVDADATFTATLIEVPDHRRPLPARRDEAELSTRQLGPR